MERLSSCYFCGDAVDASVSEFPLVSSERFDVDTDHRVVLCSSCRQKLTEVLERVLSAAFSGETPPDPETAMSEGGLTATGARAVGETSDGRPSTDTQTATADDSADVLTDVEDTESGEAWGDPEPSTADSTPEESDTTAAGSDTEDSTDESDDGGVPDTAGDDSDHATANGVTVSDDEGDGAAVAATSEGAAKADTTDEQTYANAEFNKVVRLLQNREFPVEVDELVTVAGSAYGIDEPTCHAIVAALVDRGVVTDEGDTLTRPQ